MCVCVCVCGCGCMYVCVVWLVRGVCGVGGWICGLQARNGILSEFGDKIIFFTKNRGSGSEKGALMVKGVPVVHRCPTVCSFL